jgi:TadE-like protein
MPDRDWWKSLGIIGGMATASITVRYPVRTMKRFFFCARGSAAVETAIFAPIFLVMMLGITDLGAGMFVNMTANAASQAGAAYAAFNVKSTCTTVTAACLSGIETAMNDAAGDPSFCTGSVCPPPYIGACADGSPKCISVTANYPYTPILADAVYAWGKTQTYSSTVTIRIQ